MIARLLIVVVSIALSGSVRLKPDATTALVASGVSRTSTTPGRTFWPNGQRRTEASYKDGAYDGEYRSWYANGRPFELRHYAGGHEAGLQQAWSDTGILYINYEARNGRHYGMENSTPCVEPEKSSLPYFDDRKFTPRWAPVDHRVGEFQLTTQTGKAVTGRDLAGRIHVASFIYTRCAAVCPLLVRQLLRVQEATLGMPDVMLVSFTVTPDTDSPAVLASFGRDRGVDANRWWLLTGDRSQIYALARRSYFADEERAEDFLHTEKVLLVDGGGHLRGVYNGTQPFEIDQLSSDIARLRSEAALH